MHIRGSAAAALTLLGSLACDNLVDPPLPEGAAAFSPPPVYARWWGMVEACSGISRNLEDVQWFAAPGVLQNPERPGDPVQGYYSLAGNRIVLAADDTINGSTVRHEMLHALLRAVGHPRSAFLQSCGGVVSCGPACLNEAGLPPHPDASTPRVTPDALEVSSELTPLVPSAAMESGLFTFTISVRNPADHAVVAVLPTGLGGFQQRTYSFDIRSLGSAAGFVGGDEPLDVGVTYFAAGETKRGVFDFAVFPFSHSPYDHLPGQGDGGIAFSPGTYTFRGSYGDRQAPDIDAVLNP